MRMFKFARIPEESARRLERTREIVIVRHKDFYFKSTNAKAIDYFHRLKKASSCATCQRWLKGLCPRTVYGLTAVDSPIIGYAVRTHGKSYEIVLDCPDTVECPDRPDDPTRRRALLLELDEIVSEDRIEGNRPGCKKVGPKGGDFTNY